MANQVINQSGTTQDTNLVTAPKKAKQNKDTLSRACLAFWSFYKKNASLKSRTRSQANAWYDQQDKLISAIRIHSSSIHFPMSNGEQMNPEQFLTWSNVKSRTALNKAHTDYMNDLIKGM